MNTQQAIAKAAISYLPATYKRALELVGERPSNVHEIAAHTGMTLKSAYKMVGVLKHLGVLCVVGYPRIYVRGPWTKLYGIGAKDKEPPKKLTTAERTRSFRERRTAKPLAPFTIGAYADASPT